MERQPQWRVLRCANLDDAVPHATRNPRWHGAQRDASRYHAPPMQIPEHWVEARIVGAVNGKQRVIRRFGWSDTSAEAAHEMAQRRAHEALRELRSGKTVSRRERKLPYGGAGLPIREQVLARRGDVVITRNSYGARCLNVPDVLFADLDLDVGLSRLQWAWLLASVASLALSVWSLRLPGCWTMVAVLWVPLTVFAARASWLRRQNRTRFRALRMRRLIDRVHAYVRVHPEVRFAVYETPAGLRVLALHRTFEATSPVAVELLTALGSDPAYVQMCQLQACFRARVSGKPWRMAVRHIRPRPGVWPVHPDRRALREQWVGVYEAAAQRFAACRFREQLGEGKVAARCVDVQRLHDELSRAHSDLPLA